MEKTLRMALIALQLAAIVVMPISTSHAESVFEIGPWLGHQSGHFGFKAEYISFISSGSELIFPLDQYLTGVEARYRILEGGQENWTFGLRAAISLTDPHSKFTDRDWKGITPGLETNFSFSESNVEGSSLHIDLQAVKVISSSANFDLGLLVGAGYHRFSQDAVDYVLGYFWGAVADTFYFQQYSHEGLSLTYDLYYINPVLGITPEIRISPKVRLYGQAALAPALYLSDEDNHVLRFFTIKSSGAGAGFFSEANLRVDLAGPEQKSRPYLELLFSYSEIVAPLRATVEYYDDSPNEEYQKGDRYERINHRVSVRHSFSGLRFGMAF